MNEETKDRTQHNHYCTACRVSTQLILTHEQHMLRDSSRDNGGLSYRCCCTTYFYATETVTLTRSTTGKTRSCGCVMHEYSQDGKKKTVESVLREGLEVVNGTCWEYSTTGRHTCPESSARVVTLIIIMSSFLSSVNDLSSYSPNFSGLLSGQ